MTENKSGSEPNVGSGTAGPDSASLEQATISAADDENARFVGQLQQQAQARGLDLFCAWSMAELRQADLGWLPAADHSAGLLLMFGNAGAGFWQHFQRYSEEKLPEEAGLSETLASAMINGKLGDDPIDAFAARQVTAAIQGVLMDADGAGCMQFLYPPIASNGESVATTLAHPPLQRLGELAGWHQSSPLGMGINPRWGLWYAYRALVWLPTPVGLLAKTAAGNQAEPPIARQYMQDPGVCASCESQACISACPAAALSFLQIPDMQACAGYRMQTASACADRCQAREACPVNAAEQYPRQQTSYHYRKALSSLIKYFADSKPQPRG